MLDLPTLQALLARVEAATGPNLQLVSDVCEELLPPSFIGHEAMTDADAVLWGYINADAWTDAALALIERVLPGCWWSVGHEHVYVQGELVERFVGRARKVRNSYDYLHVATAPHPALALLAAMLRALIAEREAKGE